MAGRHTGEGLSTPMCTHTHTHAQAHTVHAHTGGHGLLLGTSDTSNLGLGKNCKAATVSPAARGVSCHCGGTGSCGEK